MKNEILACLSAECPWRDTLYWYDSLDSTNTQAKNMARQGAPHGTVLIAGHQTAGRGRMGRSFSSPEAKGVYLSVILRPGCSPAELMHLTCAAGVAMAEAVENAAGITPGLKWINDLVWKNWKLGGILAEMGLDSKTGMVDYAVVGIGINCLQAPSDFPAEIQNIATSLRIAAGQEISPARLAAAMVEALVNMDRDLFSQKKQRMDRYRTLCITLGQDITVHRADSVRPGKAVGMDDDGGLIVTYPDGTSETVSSGEVSVRGLYRYI